MKIFNDCKLYIIISFCFHSIESNESTFDMREFLKCGTDYQQVTLFMSDNLKKFNDHRIATFQKFPSKIYSFS